MLSVMINQIIAKDISEKPQILNVCVVQLGFAVFHINVSSFSWF